MASLTCSNGAFSAQHLGLFWRDAHREVLRQAWLAAGPSLEGELCVQELRQLLSSVHAPRVQHLPQTAAQCVHVCCRTHSALHMRSRSG